jgi:hypothetical protein
VYAVQANTLHLRNTQPIRLYRRDYIYYNHLLTLPATKPLRSLFLSARLYLQVVAGDGSGRLVSRGGGKENIDYVERMTCGIIVAA